MQAVNLHYHLILDVVNSVISSYDTITWFVTGLSCCHLVPRDLGTVSVLKLGVNQLQVNGILSYTRMTG